MAKRWYIVHAYSNFEHKVAESIREQAAQTGLEGAFEEILVPTEEVVEMRRGRRVNSCLLYTSPSPRDGLLTRMPSSA